MDKAHRALAICLIPGALLLPFDDGVVLGIVMCAMLTLVILDVAFDFPGL